MSDWDDLFAAAAGDDNNNYNDSSVDHKQGVTSVPLSLSSLQSSIETTAPSSSNSTCTGMLSTSSGNAHKKKNKRKSNSNKSERSQRKRGGHHHNKNSSSIQQSSLYHAFLKSRVDPIEKQIEMFPSWLSLDKSFCQNTDSPYYCSVYESYPKTSTYIINSSSSTSTNTNSCRSNERPRPGLSPLYYASKCKINNPILKSVSCIRNLRSASSCIYEIMSSMQSQNHNEMEKKHPNTNQRYTIVLTLSELVNYCVDEEKVCQTVLVDVLDMVPIGEKTIFMNKLHSIKEDINQLQFAVTELRKKLKFLKKLEKKKKSNSSHHNKQCFLRTLNDTIFDHLVTLIVSIDAAYYRLYYLQVAGYLPVSGDKDGNMVHVPHPTVYFGVDNLTWNVKRGKEWSKNIISKAEKYLSKHDISCKSLSYKEIRSVMERSGFVNDDDDGVDMDTAIDMDPLSFLHNNRRGEGLLLFWSTNWIEHKQNTFYKESFLLQKQNELDSLNTSIDHQFYLRHETDAPQVLKEWRNSCRDLLCNLYGYATLAPETLNRLIEVVSQQDGINSVIEMGAGTGYLAHLLTKIGLKTIPFDIAPTTIDDRINNLNDAVNEYHGSTAPFTSVQKGCANTLTKLLKSSKVVKSAALLLCYPPPLTNMAYDMLQIYKKAGGKVIIHIGEFKGLTGSTDFEKDVQRHYKIVQRLPCLHWGTDNSEVTIWCSRREKDSLLNGSSLLLPCCNCFQKEALKQSRFSRSLRYCSRECFEAHMVQKALYQALDMIPVCIQTDKHCCFEHPSFFKTL